MEILEIHKPKYVSLTPKGELDANSSIHIDEKIDELIQQEKVNLLINCSELTYISSAGLGVFISYLEEIKQKGGQLIFSDMRDNIHDVFDLLGLSHLVIIAKTAEDADVLMNKA